MMHSSQFQLLRMHNCSIWARFNFSALAMSTEMVYLMNVWVEKANYDYIENTIEINSYPF